MRSRPARDAIQFTLDVENLDVKEDGNYLTKNLSKLEMDELKRLRRKRAKEDLVKSISTDLSKKRKLDEQTAIQV